MSDDHDGLLYRTGNFGDDLTGLLEDDGSQEVIEDGGLGEEGVKDVTGARSSYGSSGEIRTPVEE